MEISLKSLMRRQFTQDYPKYLELIQAVEKGFNAFKSSFKRKIQEILPKIRTGISSEQDLLKLINEYEQSPFS